MSFSYKMKNVPVCKYCNTSLVPEKTEKQESITAMNCSCYQKVKESEYTMSFTAVRKLKKLQ